MNEVKCPACGAPSLTQISRILFECDYCHTRYTKSGGLYVLPEEISEEDMNEFIAALGDVTKASRDLANAFKVVPVEDKPKPFPFGDFLGAWIFLIIVGLILDAVFSTQGICTGILFILGFFVAIDHANTERKKKK